MTRIEYKDLIRRTLISAEEHSAIRASMRELAKNSLFYLLVYVLKRADADRDWIYERCLEVENDPDGHLDIWAREHYKQNALDCDIYTPEGWRKFGDLEVGDMVYSPEGTPVMVQARTPIQHDPEYYDVKFETYQGDLSETISSGSAHLWDVIGIKRTVNKDHSIKKLMNTHDMYAYTKHQQTLKRKRWLRVAPARALEMAEEELPIDPYTLGVWLGDGSCYRSSITNGNDEIREKLKGEILTVRTVGNTKVFQVIGLITKLKQLGLGRVSSKEKFIPKGYLRGSIKQRTALLQGLMDTDGGVDGQGGARFSSTSKQMHEDFNWLLTSLGVLPHQYKNEKLYITGFSPYIVQCFSIKHHLDKLINRKLDYNYWYIKDVRRIKSKPSRCIQVGGGRYVIGKKLIPTHNSTITTFALTIQEMINDPEVKVVIYSFNRPTAKAFLRQIKIELESNGTLKWMFPEVFYDNPKKESPRWSEDAGLIIKRKSNPKEATLEAYGLVDGQPTSRHYSLLVYDDVVTKDSVTNTEMIDKVTYSWEMSLNTGSEGCRKRYVGTRYHYADSYKVMMDREVVNPRVYPCIEDGRSVLFTEEYIAEKKRAMGSYTFACQMMCNPKEEGSVGFLEKDLRYWDPKHLETLNIYILVDPANTKNKKSDYTGIWVIGLGADHNYYVLTMVRDKLSLSERTRTLFSLHRQYQPLLTFYERYGMQTDIEHIRYVQEQTNYRFTINEFGGRMGKEDRIIDGLQPIFEANRLFLPTTCVRQNYERKQEDLTQLFVRDEYMAFPFCIHDDMIDALARISDPNVSPLMIFPDPVSVLSIIEQAMGYKGLGNQSLEDYDPLE